MTKSFKFSMSAKLAHIFLTRKQGDTIYIPGYVRGHVYFRYEVPSGVILFCMLKYTTDNVKLKQAMFISSKGDTGGILDLTKPDPDFQLAVVAWNVFQRNTSFDF